MHRILVILQLTEPDCPTIWNAAVFSNGEGLVRVHSRVVNPIFLPRPAVIIEQLGELGEGNNVFYAVRGKYIESRFPDYSP